VRHISLLMKAIDSRSLRKVPIQEFKSGWLSLGFLYTNLHPDGVTENGAIVFDEKGACREIQLLSELSSSIFARSGWPVKLVAVGKEARRRFLQGELSYDEYYYSDMQKAGIKFLNERMVPLDASAAGRT